MEKLSDWKKYKIKKENATNIYIYIIIYIRSKTKIIRWRLVGEGGKKKKNGTFRENRLRVLII